jgi:hypothetical protein
VAALMLCTVAFLNGGPIYYADTSAYLLDADRLFHLHAPYAVRPIFYGLVIWICREVWPFAWGAQFGLALFVQAFVVAHIIYLTMRAVGAALRPAGFLLLTAALVVLTPISFHVSHMLPDIYIAVMTLALFLLGFCREALRRWEVIYLFVLSAVSATFHLTALPVGATIAGLAILFALAGQRWARPSLVIGPMALAVVAMLAFSFTVYQRLTLTPNSPPHLLARILTDGPGTDYLRATCPGSGYTMCKYLDRLPPTYEGFLWVVMPSVPPADGYKIKAEQGRILRGTLAMFPAQVARHALDNALWQIVTFESETHFSPSDWAEFRATGSPIALALSDTWQAKGALDSPALDPINDLHAGIAFISLLVALGTLPRLITGRLTRPAALTTTILIVLLGNAAACGILSGVFARYQGRVIWLLPMVAVIAIIILVRQTRYAQTAKTLASAS